MLNNVINYISTPYLIEQISFISEKYNILNQINLYENCYDSLIMIYNMIKLLENPLKNEIIYLTNYNNNNHIGMDINHINICRNVLMNLNCDIKTICNTIIELKEYFQNNYPPIPIPISSFPIYTQYYSNNNNNNNNQFNIYSPIPVISSSNHIVRRLLYPYNQSFPIVQMVNYSLPLSTNTPNTNSIATNTTPLSPSFIGNNNNDGDSLIFSDLDTTSDESDFESDEESDDDSEEEENEENSNNKSNINNKSNNNNENSSNLSTENSIYIIFI